MKLSFPLFVTAQLLLTNPVDSKSRELKKGKKSKGKTDAPTVVTRELPEIFGLIAEVFNFWEVDETGARVEEKPCTVDSCEWNPYYITKHYDGLHPDLGGHPTDIDVRYAFYYGSPFLGQNFPGSPLHCESKAPADTKPVDCPPVTTLDDSGPSGPGFIPPHIGLAALTWAIQEGVFSVDDIFDYDLHGCRVVPDILLKMIRNYFPRTVGEVVSYPPPFTPEGGDFQYEFPAGNGIDNQDPPYAPGPPHWCEPAYLETGNWPDFCPYIFEGANAGKYRHPHIAYAALEVFLAHENNPAKCKTTWLENNPDFINPDRVGTEPPFPVLTSDAIDKTTIENWLGQPTLPYDYTQSPPRAASGNYVNEFVLRDTRR